MCDSDRSYSQDSFQGWLRERFTFDQEDIEDITQSIPPFMLLDFGSQSVRSLPDRTDQQVPAQTPSAVPPCLDCRGDVQTAPVDATTGQGPTTSCSQPCSQPQKSPWLLPPSEEQQQRQWQNQPAQTLEQLPLHHQQHQHLSPTSEPVLSTDQQSNSRSTAQHGYRSPFNLLLPSASSSAAAAAAARPVDDQLAQLLSDHTVPLWFQPPSAAVPAGRGELAASTATPAARAYDVYNPADSVLLPLHMQHDSICRPAAVAIPTAPAAVMTSKRTGSDSETGPDLVNCLLGSPGAAGAGRCGKASAGSDHQRMLLTSPAQRRAHQRYRQRRKEKIGWLQSDLFAKQSTLEALQQEHTALKAKARALDQLVISAGDDMALIQELQHLTLEQQQQQHQQSEEGLSQQQPCMAKEVQGALQSMYAVRDSSKGHPSAAAATTAAAGGGGSPASHWQVQTTACDSSEYNGNGNGNGIASTARSSSGAAGRPIVGSAEYMQAALFRVLAGANSSGRVMSSGDRRPLTGPLESLRSVVKSVVMEAAQLLLQIQEQKKHHQQQQQQEVQQAPGLDWPPAVGSSPTNDVSDLTNKPQTQSVSPGMAPGMASSNCPALMRLHWLMNHVRAEFRKFAVSNRVSLYQLYTLNLDSGELGGPPPPGHWAKVARILKDRLPSETLSDFCVARQLYSRSLRHIKQQRQQLVLQLQQLLNSNSGSSVAGVRTLTELDDPACRCAALLDAIEQNLRREFALDGVFQWLFHKLITPLVTAEMLVHSWPYMIDTHLILEEVLKEPQNVAVVSAVQALEL